MKPRAGVVCVERRQEGRLTGGLTCDFLVGAEPYRGIVLDLSTGGLSLQTDAKIPLGTELVLQLGGLPGARSISLLAVVSRDRPPADTDHGGVVHGIGLRVIEAPAEFAAAVEAFEAARAEVSMLAPAEEEPSPDVLLVDDGELDDVHELLRTLDAQPCRLRPDEILRADSPPWPTQVFICSARAALSLPLPRSGEHDDAVAIAITEDGSQTVQAMMRRLGFRYVVRRPVHPEALRLLLHQALYRGGNRRREARLPFGSLVGWRVGWRRGRALLAEISSDGCRLVGPDTIALGARIKVRIGGDATGGSSLSLAGEVVRRERKRSQDAPDGITLGVAFRGLRRRTRRRLEALLADCDRGPASLCDAEVPRQRLSAVAPGSTNETLPARQDPADGGSHALAPVISLSTGSESSAATEEPPKHDRRRSRRSALNREVVAFDESSRLVTHSLVGRDLSRGGMRVEPHPALALGEQLSLALFDGLDRAPLIIEAEVTRNDGTRGWVLRFRNVEPELASRIERVVEELPAVESLEGGEPEPQKVYLGEFMLKALRA